MRYNTRRLTYHPPTEEQRLTYEAINQAFITLAKSLEPLLPQSGDTTVAMRQIEMARMYCNLAVALENDFPVLIP